MEERSRALHERLPVSLILGVSMIAAGVVYPVTDSALKHTSPIMIATLRALVGGLILTLALPLLRSRLPRTRRLWAWACAIGFGNTTLTQVGISVGTARAGAAVASVLLNSSPFFVALIARFALGEPITRLRAIGLLIGFGGVLLVVLADPGNVAHGPRLAIGFVLALLGALGWAGGGLGMRALTQREPDLDLYGHTAAQFLAGAIPLIPLALIDGGTTTLVGRRRVLRHKDAEQLSRASRCPGQGAQNCFRAAPGLIPAAATHLSCAEGAHPEHRRLLFSPLERPIRTSRSAGTPTSVLIGPGGVSAALAGPPAPRRIASTSGGDAGFRFAREASARDGACSAPTRRGLRRARSVGGERPARVV